MENRIPPPVVAFFFLLIAFGFDAIFPFDVLPGENADVLFFILGGLGLGVMGAGVISFRQHRTTVNPLDPEKATSLVTTGIYRFTRNPMYLGMVMIVLGAALATSDLSALLAPLGLWFWLTHLQIIPEERALTKLFGDDFTAYCQRVRRWI